MDNLLKEHFNQILSGTIDKAIADYNDSLICIAHVNKCSETLNCAGAHALMLRLQQVLDFSDVQVLVNKTTAGYGVLTLKSGFAPFLSYTCIVKNGKIACITLYAYRPVEDILPSRVTPMEKCKAASKLFGKHVRAMFSLKASVITKDYAEDAVVITNMAKDICSGKAQIYNFCDSLMKCSLAIIKKMNFRGLPSVRWSVKSAGSGLLLFTCEAPAMGMIMTETYWIENGKIQYENSIADGAVLDSVHELLTE